MRVIFCGFGELGDAVFQSIVDVHEVCAVVTHPGGFSGLTDPAVEKRANSHSIPVFYSVSAREPSLHRSLLDLEADLLVSTNWRTKMPSEMLDLTPMGAINLHDALLPEYAGFGAVNWAIRDGRDETGLTVHFMDDELDTGPIVYQTSISISSDETAGSVYRRLVALYGPTAIRAIKLVENGSRGVPQTAASGFFGHRITIHDTRIFWSEASHRIVNLVRAQDGPFINAWCIDEGRRLFVTRASLPGRAVRGTPGRVVGRQDGGVLVGCGSTGLPDSRGVSLVEVRPEGTSEPLPAVDYFGKITGARYLS